MVETLARSGALLLQVAALHQVTRKAAAFDYGGDYTNGGDSWLGNAGTCIESGSSTATGAVTPKVAASSNGQWHSRLYRRGQHTDHRRRNYSNGGTSMNSGDHS
ncbi:hypothetical protein K438DRAFT_2008928 [Mycena galopus ATCC 62051]|nr:hypothetical protein K438DRAFT_2008928 [Mycena galopus ATCC 62051]